jgi:hypothetical protein
LSRLESANVGVLLFCPEKDFLAARMSRENTRIRQFFGSEGHDWKRINSFKKGFEERLEVERENIQSLEDLERFIATRANELQITPPRSMRVENPETQIDELFNELVGGHPMRQRQSNLRQYIGNRFDSAGISHKLRQDIRVTVPVFNREVQVPYGYQNGRFHLIQPVRFESREPLQVVSTACRYAVEGRSLHESTDAELGPMKLVVVGKFSGETGDTKATVERIFAEHEVRLFRLEELPNLIDEIRRTAKDMTDTRSQPQQVCMKFGEERE